MSPRRSLLSKYNKILWCTNQCNFIYGYNISTAFLVPIFSEVTNAHYIMCTAFTRISTGRPLNVEGKDGNHWRPSLKCHFYCADFHEVAPSHYMEKPYTEFQTNRPRSAESMGKHFFRSLSEAQLSQGIFTKLALTRRDIVNNFCTEFHENLTHSLWYDARSQRGGSCLHARPLFTSHRTP